ncbi:hypothetical protein C8Q77DRAFT_1081786 [Trametes polyzona]|nr:hypothetical protein C8Q77DRAFT_1081786 [Trametes polyzona]
MVQKWAQGDLGRRDVRRRALRGRAGSARASSCELQRWSLHSFCTPSHSSPRGVPSWPPSILARALLFRAELDCRHSAMTSTSGVAFRKFDDTDPILEYTGDWFDNPRIANVFNNTLSSTTHAGDTVHIEFTASQIVVIGATVGPFGASPDAGPVSGYTLDGAKNSVFLFQGDVANATSVVFFNSGPLSFGKHTLDITVLRIEDDIPYLLDEIFIQEPIQTSTSTAVWVSTVFVTPTAAPSSITDQNISGSTSTSSVPTGAIVGGAVGGAALLVIAALAFYFLYFRRRRHGVYAYHSFGQAPPLDSEKDDPKDAAIAPARIEPFVSPLPTSVYSDTPPYAPTATAPSVVPSTPGSPHSYPPPTGSVSGSRASGSGAGSSTGRTLSVVNDTSDGAYLTPAQRKAAEAKRMTTDSQSVQYHADSGVRFDSEGRPIEAPASEVQPLSDVPPEYTPS